MSVFREQPPWLVAAMAGTAVMLVLIFGPLGLPGRIKFLYKVRLPETRWSYSHRSIEEFASKTKEQGIRTYRRQLRWDILFALLFSASLVALIDALWGRSLDADQAGFRWVVWIPAVYAVFDLAEDVVLLIATGDKNLSWPGDVPSLRAGAGLVATGRIFTRLKWVSVGVALFWVVVGGVSLTLFGPGR